MPFPPPSPAQKELHTGELPRLSNSFYRRLKITVKENLLSTKGAPDCGDADPALERAQSDTLDYNRNYRLSDSRRRRVSKALPRILPPLALFNHRLKIIWRKNLRGIKRAGDFAEACWRSGKKVLLHALACIGPALYKLLKTAWSPACAGLLSTKSALEDEAGQAPSDTLDYNRTSGWRGGPPPRQNKNWIPRIALAEAIALSLLLANGYAGGGFLRVAGITLPSNPAAATAGAPKGFEAAGLAIAWTINDVIAGAFHGSGTFQSAPVANETTNRHGNTSGAKSSGSDSRPWTSSWSTLSRGTVSNGNGTSQIFRALADILSTHKSAKKPLALGSSGSNSGIGFGAGSGHATGTSAVLPTAGIGTEVAGGANTNSQKTVPSGGGNASGLVTNTLATDADITSGNSAAGTQTGIGTAASTIGGVSSGSGSGSGGTAPSASAVIDPDGTWIANANGTWSTTTNWSGGIVADGGGFANFSTLNITGNRTVTVNTTSRTVRRIDIGDTNNTNFYTINASGGASLIFDNTANSANAQLNEVLNSNGDTISAPIVLNSSLDITNASPNTLTLSGAITAGTAGTKTITTSMQS